MNCYFFRRAVLIILVIAFIPTIGLAQEDKDPIIKDETQKERRSKLVNDAIELIIEEFRKKQSKSSSKNNLCPKFSTPVFNPFNVTFDTENTPRCHDFSIIDVAKKTENTRFSKSATEYNSIRKFSLGDEIVAMIYINNGADPSLDTKITEAKNVKIFTQVTNNGNLYTLTSKFTGNNMREVSAKVQIEVGSDEKLEVIPNSGAMYNYRGQLHPGADSMDIGNSIIHLGELNAGAVYSIFFSYRLSVEKK